MACDHTWLEHYSLDSPEPWKPDMRVCLDCGETETLQEAKIVEHKGDGVSTWGTKVATSAGKFFGWRNRIYGRNNEHATVYMTRFWIGRLRLHIFHRGDNDPDHHDHPWGFWTFPLTSYVEEVVDGDLAFLGRVQTVVAPGGVAVRRNVVKAWRLHYRPATHTHRVLGRYSGNVNRREDDAIIHGVPADYANSTSGVEPYFDQRRIVTIVWRGKDERKWGFLKNRDGRWCWVHWKEYVFRGGKDAPCGD